MDINLENSRILVVDDDQLILDMLTTWLEVRGYRVTCAKNGREALQLHQQNNFDLILLDIMMPEVNGYEVLRQLKSDGDDTPVVVMSALDDVKSVIMCIKLGAEDYLDKPVESELLWARITALLEKKHIQDLQQTMLEELSLLHQIDQQLNTTLNREEVSRLTLKAVMQKTGALAGLLGSIEECQLRLRATLQVNENEVPAMLPAELTRLKNQKEISQDAAPEDGRLHPSATTRLTIPIFRNDIIRDIVILDLASPAAPATIRFLNRLSTHTAIALHNSQLYADVQAANQAKSNFVAMVSHELKNPLTAIQSYTQILQHKVGSLPLEKQAEFLGVIFDGSERIHNLALELDDITQMETGQFRLSLSESSFQEILDNVLRMMESQIAEKEQSVGLDIPEALPTVLADKKRLSQIMTNLLSNACKYSHEGGQITIAAKLVTEEEVTFLRISVEDNGIGIAPMNQEKIFSQFFRADDPHVNQVRGTGLGLNITKKLVELQGGTIGFTTKHQVGSTFFFTVPVAATMTAELETAVPSSA